MQKTFCYDHSSQLDYSCLNACGSLCASASELSTLTADLLGVGVISTASGLQSPGRIISIFSSVYLKVTEYIGIHTGFDSVVLPARQASSDVDL